MRTSIPASPTEIVSNDGNWRITTRRRRRTERGRRGAVWLAVHVRQGHAGHDRPVGLYVVAFVLFVSAYTMVDSNLSRLTFGAVSDFAMAEALPIFDHPERIPPPGDRRERSAGVSRRRNALAPARDRSRRSRLLHLNRLRRPGVGERRDRLDADRFRWRDDRRRGFRLLRRPRRRRPDAAGRNRLRDPTADPHHRLYGLHQRGTRTSPTPSSASASRSSPCLLGLSGARCCRSGRWTTSKRRKPPG